MEGWTARSVIVMLLASEPIIAATLPPIESTAAVPVSPLLLSACPSSAKIDAARLSATKSVPSAPKAIGPMDCNSGSIPVPVAAPAGADQNKETQA